MGERATARHPSCYHVCYSLSCAEYDGLLALCGGRCMICRSDREALCVDHDHSLGFWAVRGMVCQGCNQHLRRVDAGERPALGATARYLASAWHLSQPASAAKKARTRRRVHCEPCGIDVALRANGTPYRHWSRVFGQQDEVCLALADKYPEPHAG